MGVADQNSFTALRLGTKWSDPNKRSAFFGTFSQVTGLDGWDRHGAGWKGETYRPFSFHGPSCLFLARSLPIPTPWTDRQSRADHRRETDRRGRCRRTGGARRRRRGQLRPIEERSGADGRTCARAAAVAASAFQADLSHADQLRRRSSPRSLHAFGRLDILVHMASVYKQRPFDETDSRRLGWRRSTSTCARRSLCAHAAVPHMRAQRRRPHHHCSAIGSRVADGRAIRDFCRTTSPKAA